MTDQETSKNNARQQPGLIRLADLPSRKVTRFRLAPDAAARAALAAELDISGIRKLNFECELAPIGRADWQLTARLGATVVQPCVVTLVPVTTRIDEDVRRTYLAEMPEVETGDEVEMPEDDSIDPLPVTLDLAQVMAESLALALPLYPRVEGAKLDVTVVTEPGKAPMKDEDTRPFAGLSALRDRLKSDRE